MMKNSDNKTHAKQINELADAAKILDQADVRKKDYFKDKFEEFLKHRDWSTNTFRKDYSDLRQEIRSIEDIIQDLQDDIKEIERQKDRERNEYNKHGKGIEKLESITLKAGKNPTLKQLLDKADEKDRVRVKIGVWKGFQSLMDRLGRIKMFKVATTYDTIHEKAEAQEKFEEYAENKVGQMRSELKEHTERLVENRTHKLEKATEAARREFKIARSYLTEFGEAEKESLARISEKWQQLPEVSDESELDELVGSEGYGVDLEGSQTDAREKKESFEEVRDTHSQTEISSGEDGSEYKFKRKSMEERRDELQRMWQEEDVLNMTQRDIDQKIDVSRQYLFDSGNILDRIQEAYEKGEFDGDSKWLEDFREGGSEK